MGARLSALRDPITLTVGALAVHRITRLAVEDEVTRPLRERITRWADPAGYGPDDTRSLTRRAHPALSYFVTCPWCVSMYVAAGWAALTVTAPAAAATAGAALAWSSVTGILASVE